MKNKGRHLWFSKKQKHTQSTTSPIAALFAKLDTGETIEYTEMSQEKRPSGIHDDYVYLGRGEYSHAITENVLENIPNGDIKNEKV